MSDPLIQTCSTRIRATQSDTFRSEANAAVSLGFSIWRDGYACILFICLLSLAMINLRGMGGFGEWLFSARWGILCVAAFAGTLQVACASNHRRALTGEHYCLIAMMILGMLSCSYSFMPLYSIQRLASFALLWVTLFGGAWTWLQSYRNVLLGTHLVFVLICVVSFLSLVHLGQEGLVERTIRAKGAFGRPTGAGGFAGVAIPIVLWKIRYSRGLVLWIALLVLATQGYVLLFSGARGAIIASAISLPIMAWRLYRSSRGVIVILLLVTGSGIAGGFLGLSNLPDYVVRRDTIEGLSGRTSRYEVAWHLIKKRPLLGWGFGVARYATSMDREALAILSGEGTFSESSAYMEKQLASGTPVAVALHSEQLERLVETGILGGLCFILFWGLLTRDIWLALVGPQNSASELVVALAASCWFLFLNTFLHAELFAIGMGTTTCYWFIIVLTIAGSRHHQSMSHGRVA